MKTRALVLIALLFFPGLVRAASTVEMSWTDNSLTESGFIVQRRQGMTGAFVELTRTAANATTYTDPTPLPGSTWCYQIVTFRNQVMAAPSNLACVDIPAPLESASGLNVKITIQVVQ